MYVELRIEERVAAGELTYVQERDKPKPQPKEDQLGRVCTHNVFGVIIDPSLPEDDAGGIVAKVHFQRTSSGEIGFSGKRDPKLITKGRTRYIDLAPGFACELCTTGDMIPSSQRFKYSTYRP